jgi:hypothetical protein
LNEKKKVLIVGGLPFNIPAELREIFDIVKHVEEGTARLADLPAVDYVFVMSDFASHKMLQVVKDRATAPIIYLRKGWASMKEELALRCILPPDQKVAEAAVKAAQNPETGTLSGLSEDELWKTYKPKFIEAVKTMLKPRDLVSEADLLEVLALVGVPAEDCRLVLPRLQIGGVIDSPKDGFWRSLMGQGGFDFGDGSPEPVPSRKSSGHRPRTTFNQLKKGEADERARRLKGLPMGPYPSKRAIAREMLKYEEWNPDGTPVSDNTLSRLIERAINLRVIDDTHTNLLIDHDPAMGLRKIVKNGAPEEVPIPLPMPEKTAYDLYLEGRVAAQENLETLKSRWPEVIQKVKKEKKMIGTILESCRIQWIEAERMAVCLVPAEFAMYRLTLEATENWGFVSKVAREILGQDFVVRFLMENRVAR